MDKDPPREGFDDIVDALLMPTSPLQKPATTPQVADLYCGDGELGRAAHDVGFDVVYTSDPDSARGALDFTTIPPFDILTANMPDTGDEQEEAFEFVLRFLRVPPTGNVLAHGHGVVYQRGGVPGVSSKQDGKAWLPDRQGGTERWRRTRLPRGLAGKAGVCRGGRRAAEGEGDQDGEGTIGAASGSGIK